MTIEGCRKARYLGPRVSQIKPCYFPEFDYMARSQLYHGMPWYNCYFLLIAIVAAGLMGHCPLVDVVAALA